MCVLQVASSSSGVEFVERFDTPPPPPPPEEPDHRSGCIPPPPPPIYSEVLLGVRCVLVSPVCLQVRSGSTSALTSGATPPLSSPAPVPLRAARTPADGSSVVAGGSSAQQVPLVVI